MAWNHARANRLLAPEADPEESLAKVSGPQDHRVRCRLRFTPGGAS